MHWVGLSEIQGALSKISLYTILAPPQATPWFNHLNLQFCYDRVKDTTGMSPIKQTHPPPSPHACVGSCRCCGCGSSSSSSYSASSPSLSCPAPSSMCGHLPLLHLSISHAHRPPPSYAYTGGIPRCAHTLHPHGEMNKFEFLKSFFHFFLLIISFLHSDNSEKIFF